MTKKRSIKLVVAFPWWKWIVNPFGMRRVKKYLRNCEDIIIEELEKPEAKAEFELILQNLFVYGYSHPEIFSDEEKAND